jgi:hypothetical protein
VTLVQQPTPTHGPILQAFVRRVRANDELYGRLTGGIHQGFAPEKFKYPIAIYNLVFGPYDYQWGSVTLIAGIDLFVFSRNPVEADNFDQELAGWLSDQPLPVEGQATLYCRRVATVPSPPDVDDEGEKVYQVGGTYEIWTDVSLTHQVFAVGATDTLPTASDSA